MFKKIFLLEMLSEEITFTHKISVTGSKSPLNLQKQCETNPRNREWVSHCKFEEQTQSLF